MGGFAGLEKVQNNIVSFYKKFGVLSFNSMDRVVNERLCILAYSFKGNELGMGISTQTKMRCCFVREALWQRSSEALWERRWRHRGN